MRERGFLKPDGTYSQAIDGDRAFLSDYPEGTVEVPIRPGPHWYWENKQWNEGALPPKPFPTLTRVQFLAALEIDLGKSEADVEAAIDILPETTPEEIGTKKHARIAFRNGQSFGRNDPLLLALLPMMGLDEADIDAAWRAAKEKY